MVLNTLFNQSLMNRYIRKYKKEFRLSHPKRTALNKWYNKLEDGELEDEVSNYGNFSRIILEEILGYDYDKNVVENEREDYGRGFSEFALKKNDKKFMIIELKGSEIDLDKPQNRLNDKRTPVGQAFDYVENSKENVEWIFVSNYKEFRLYNWVKRKRHFISFKFEELFNDDVFRLFMLIFSKLSTDNGLIENLISKTIFVERDLEDEFYKLYNETRLMLIAEIEYLHPDFELDQSIHYAQLILNRYIFICFAEDLDLLPGQISIETIENPIDNQTIGRNGIWQGLNSLFLDINEGNDLRDEEIFGYNGGLFSEDLEFLKIRDIVRDQTIFKDTDQHWKFEEYSLIVEEKVQRYSKIINPVYKNLMTISTFSFVSELDVNILGHIFENSIGDIEELKDSNIERRKLEGIFYTRDFITDYICRNTIIPYLSVSGEKNSVEGLINEYWGSKIDDLDLKLKNIKIIDPACGSGAFLNKASDILMEIHEAIHIYRYKDEDESLKPYFDNIITRREILLNNIYGVDLNDESVEITKLSLFLKVCRKGLKLPNLDNNIKCGNSIIEDSNYSDKAFDWKNEYKEIFNNNNGFDLVIGNPPYIATKKIKSEDREYFWEEFKKYLVSEMDTYEIFTIKSINTILKDNGRLGFIIPNSFYTTSSFIYLRKLLLKQNIKEILDFPYRFFPFIDTNKETTIIILEKNSPDEDSQVTITSIDKKTVENENLIDINNHDSKKLFQCNFYSEKDNYKFYITANSISLKIHINESKFGKYINAHKGWMSVPKITEIDDTIFEKQIFNLEDLHNNPKLKSICEPCLEGEDIALYFDNFRNKFVNTSKIAKKTNNWHKNDKIIMQRITGQGSRRIIACYDNGKYIAMPNTNLINLKEDSTISLYSLLGIINSKLMDYYYKKMYGESNTNITADVIEGFPLPDIDNKEYYNKIEKNVKRIIEEKKDLINSQRKLQQILMSNFGLENIPPILTRFYLLDQEILIKILIRLKLNLRQQKKVLEFLDSEKKDFKDKHISLISLIDEVDNLTFKIYDLDDKEIDTIIKSYK